jgi:hypothetical protein
MNRGTLLSLSEFRMRQRAVKMVRDLGVHLERGSPLEFAISCYHEIREENLPYRKADRERRASLTQHQKNVLEVFEENEDLFDWIAAQLPNPLI